MANNAAINQKNYRQRQQARKKECLEILTRYRAEVYAAIDGEKPTAYPRFSLSDLNRVIELLGRR